MNQLEEKDIHKLGDLLKAAILTPVAPLVAHVTSMSGKVQVIHAFNEVTILRKSHQACHLRIEINEIVRMEKLIGDGLLVSTPAGSTAYNYSAGGPILPLGAQSLALTPLNPYIPRRWRGAIIENKARIKIDIIEPEARPIYVTADRYSIENVSSILIEEDKDMRYGVLFDPMHNLEARILNQQFL
jgi:NAD+ kinase